MQNEQTGFKSSNLWNNRNVCASPNIGWHLDVTFVNVCLENKPKSKHYIYSAIDPATNRFIFTKTFFSSNGSKSLQSTQTVKVLRKALIEEKINQPLIIHSDRGGNFMSKTFRQFINSEPLLLHSFTDGGAPYDNGVIERSHYTLKCQFLKFREKIPPIVKKTTDLEKIIDRIKIDLNQNSTPIKNYYLPPNEMHKILLNSPLDLPQVTFTQNNSKNLARQCEQNDIEAFRYNSVALSFQKNISFQDIENDVLSLLKAFFAKTNNMEKAMERFHALDSARFDYLEDKHEESLELQRFSVQQNEQILAKLEPKKRLKKKAVPERDQLTLPIFCELHQELRPKHAHMRSWGRFQLTCAILAFTGARLNELRFISHDDVKTLIREKRLQLYQPKVNKFREIIIVDIGVSFISETYERYKKAVFAKHDFIFPPSPNNVYNGDQFIRLINKYLEPFSAKHNLKLKSHSFRINFATTILQATNAQNAQQIIGHKDIRSTMTYNRYQLNGQEKNKILEKAFEQLKE